jgi:hypothetical protein
MGENDEMNSNQPVASSPDPDAESATSDPPSVPSMPVSHEPSHPPPAPDEKPDLAASTDAEIERQLRRMTRRSFLWAAAAATTGYAGWRWLVTRREDNGLPWPLRRTLEINEHLARDYFDPARLSPTFPRAMAAEPRVNGDVGLSEDFDSAAWTLRLEGSTESSDPLLLTLDDIKAFPRAEMVTELKCIEGWSQVVHWAGARFADFIATYPPETRSGDPPDVRNKPADLVGYVYLKTPDGDYYVGLEMASALHPQTLLCYEMNGEPLTPDHGAPLRLVIPVKYGIKSIKRIGAIRFTDVRPTDYWAERGYDWYAGH